MKATKNINIYLIDKKPIKVIDVVQYDTGIQLVFTVKDFPIPSDATATLYVEKPSGKFVYQKDNITVSGNTITVDLENQALTEHGRIPYQVTVTSGSDTVTSFAGLMIVERSLKDAGAVESKTVIKAFDELTAEKLAELQTNAKTVVDALIATIPDDYTELTAKINESANAIKGNLSGVIVSADDVSPVEHLMNVNVHGKNLLPNNILDVSTWQLATGTTNNHLYPLTFLKDGQTYTISGIKKDVSDGYFYIEKSNDGFVTNSDIHLITPNNFFMPVTFAKEAGWDYRFFWYGQGVMLSDCVENLQLEKGNTATEYTPYVDPSTVKVKRCGKSIFSKSSQVVSGVSKPWTSLLVAAVKVPSGNYVASCNFKQRGQDISRVALSVRSYEDYSIAFGDDSSGENSGYLEKSFTVPNSSSGFQIFLYSNQPNEALTTECLFENIQVELGQKATDFEPYKGTEYIPTSDGVVDGVTSLSPNMTLLTDTEGVIVECEYNKDTNKVIKKITDALGITI